MAGLTLIVAEKPSVARDIARVVGARARRTGYLEGSGYRVTWCIGHLAELCEPHEYDPRWKSWSPGLLPIAPEQFRVRATRAGAAQLRVIRSLMRDPEVGTVINACDAGREGELIFRFVCELVGCTRPVRRLWISSLTDGAIRAGLGRLRAGAELDALADAARCRAEADWLVGMNATRALTARARRGGGRALLSVGRVQTPTLALLVRREDAIEAFVSEPFWEVVACFSVADPGADAPARYRGTWERPAVRAAAGTGKDGREGEDGNHGKAHRTRLATEAEARAIVAAVRDRPGRITRAERKHTREAPPLLFDLTELQKVVNRRHGLSAERTLAAAQALYERHKAITYPRTDSRHLTRDMAGQLPDLVGALEPTAYGALARQARAGASRPGRRIVDDAQVGDHHAIIPTGVAIDPARLAGDEQRVYDAVVRRFLAALMPDARFDDTRLDTEVEGHRFVSRGRVCVDPGWQAAEPPPRRAKDTPVLPAVSRDDAVHTDEAEIRAGKTEPPRRYTDATLLGAMDRADRTIDDAALRRALRDKGLGTPATRAAIIENLIRRRYVRRAGKELHPTAQGRALIAAVPVDDLLSAELTGAWEQKLARIATGAFDRPRFMAEIRAFVAGVVASIAAADDVAVPVVGAEVLGRCPVCGGAVTEGFRAYECAGGRDCSFVIFKKIAGRSISPALVQTLLGRRQSRTLRGFRSKKGKRFAAALALTDAGTVELVFEGRGAGPSREHSPRPSRAARPSTTAPAARPPRAAKQPAERSSPAGPRCPACRKGRIVRGKRAWGCSCWREGCRFVVSFEQGGTRVPDEEAERLFRRGQTRLMPGLSDAGRARLVLDLERDGNVRVELGKRARRAGA